MSIQVGTSHADSLTGSGSLDLLFGRGGADTLTGGNGISGLFGGKGGDTLHDGTSGYSFMFGGRGDDVVVSTHADLMDGGCGGTDTAVLLRSASTQSFNIDLSKCLNVLADGTVMTGFERLVFDGGSGNDVVKGGGLDDYLAGGAGHDALYGGGGNDLILGMRPTACSAEPATTSSRSPRCPRSWTAAAEPTRSASSALWPSRRAS